MSMQIKTIIMRLDYAEDFDVEVNTALLEGWHLTRRAVLQPPSQPNDGAHYMNPMLLAELVKDDAAAQEPEPAPITWQQAVETIKGICAGREECCDEDGGNPCPMWAYCVENTPAWGVPCDWPEVPHD